jgi:hypothetical protein
MSKHSDNYAKELSLRDVIVVKSVWREESSGRQNEYTTDDIICIQGERCYRMTIEVQELFPWTPLEISYRIIDRIEISQDEYEKIKKENERTKNAP